VQLEYLRIYLGMHLGMKLLRDNINAGSVR